ncbi:MAG: DUF5110 domain-containing protein [Alphaproteobacteria bacterium]
MRTLILATMSAVVGLTGTAMADPVRTKFTAGSSYLIVEVLDENLMHFEYSANGSGPGTNVPLAVSPMVDKTDYPGASSPILSANGVETGELKAAVDSGTLCVLLTDKVRNVTLTRVCPADLAQDWKGLSLSREGSRNVYGLGQQFKTLGSADGDWIAHKVREAQPAGQAQSHGNGFMGFGNAGMVGNVQFPILYALGSSHAYALFLDSVYKQQWDFQSDPWTVRTWGDQVRFYVFSGPRSDSKKSALADLRSRYLDLVGRPPVPPRKAFGLWVSEFGYKNFDQVKKLRDGLRQDNFPVDGFVFDLQWFGGVKEKDANSAMGRLDWDTANFADPQGQISAFAADHVGFVTIEESYVSKNTNTYGTIQTDVGTPFAFQRTSANVCNTNAYDPVTLNEWFGSAGMLDWSNPYTGQWIHDNRRFPNMVQKGVLGHWTDLGEPEKYDGNACYKAEPSHQHGDIHNIYNFLWNRSIYDGYVRKNSMVNRRPFIVTRSGTSGTQRWGAAMWSGDIGSNLQLLASHQNAQMHMSMSGIDYYGSDIGGFRREGMPYNENHSGKLQYQDELFTQWFANGAWFDVPVRPHTDNSFQTRLRYETSPNLVGSKASNLANLRQRYELVPYYYTLAHRAHTEGEPVIGPLVYHFENDSEVRNIGHEKMVGKDLLVGVVASHGEYQRDVYLPQGAWVNWHTNEWFPGSSGRWIRNFPNYVDGVFRLPVFARAGAIIPMMPVDEQTKDVFNHLKNGGQRTDLKVRVFADAAPSAFDLIEDDGETVHFDAKGKPVYDGKRTTRIEQRLSNGVVTVTINAASGTYPSAPASRDVLVQIVLPGSPAAQVTVDGRTVASGTWRTAGHNLIEVPIQGMNVAVPHTVTVSLGTAKPSAAVNFACDNGWTIPGESIRVVGNTPELGNWNPAKGIDLSPSVYWAYIYDKLPNPGPSTPKWTGVVQNLPANTLVEWKCIKRNANGTVTWQQGGNNKVTTTPGFAWNVRRYDVT